MINEQWENIGRDADHTESGGPTMAPKIHDILPGVILVNVAGVVFTVGRLAPWCWPPGGVGALIRPT